MTNGEKNKKRFDELGIGDLSAFEIARRIAVRKSGDVDMCNLTPCKDCIFKRGSCVTETEEWLKSEAKPDKPKHRLFISCPMDNRTEDNIRKSFKKMLKIAEACTGETFRVVNPYIPKKAAGDADRIKYLADSINLMAGADYFITTKNFWSYRECSVEKVVAEKYGLKSLYVDPEFTTPDVFDHDEPRELDYLSRKGEKQ